MQVSIGEPQVGRCQGAGMANYLYESVQLALFYHMLTALLSLQHCKVKVFDYKIFKNVKTVHCD